MTRRKLPPVRPSVTQKTWIGCDCVGPHDAKTCGGAKVYLVVGLFLARDPVRGVVHSPGEVFLTVATESGGAFAGFADAWSVEVSVGLQSGRTVDELLRRYRGSHFPPCGRTSDPEIPEVSSIPDYVVRWLDLRFGEAARLPLFPPLPAEAPVAPERPRRISVLEGQALGLISPERRAEEPGGPDPRVCGACSNPIPEGVDECPACAAGGG